MLNFCATQGLTSNKDLSKNSLYVYELKRIMSVAHSAVSWCDSHFRSTHLWFSVTQHEGRVLLPETAWIHTARNKSLLGFFCCILL